MRMYEDDFYDDAPTLIEQLIEEKRRKGLLPKTSYTKDEVIAMLTEIQLEIEEKFNDRPFSYNHHQRTEFYRDIDEVIQLKINSIKENT